jgi:acetyl esterase/lipase
MRRRLLLFPFLMLADRGVTHRRAVVYSEDPKLRLDVYRPASERHGGGPLPAVIQVHGGGWIVGSRLEQGIPLLNHLAKAGWVGFNIDYRLSPQATWPDHIVDVKRAIAWVRDNAEEYGVDPERICITGGSAGGHLVALAGLTENDPAFQPGFEGADTSVSAAVPFYGIYDLVDDDVVYWKPFRSWVLETIVFKRPVSEERELYVAASPRYRVHEDAPPFLVLHGEHDTLVPVRDARTLVAELQRVSRSDVRYIEFPDGEHAFDVLPSIRTSRAVEGIERFLRASVEPRTNAGRNAGEKREPATAAAR